MLDEQLLAHYTVGVLGGIIQRIYFMGHSWDTWPQNMAVIHSLK